MSVIQIDEISGEFVAIQKALVSFSFLVNTCQIQYTPAVFKLKLPKKFE